MLLAFTLTHFAAMDGSSRMYNIDKLSDSNFHVWNVSIGGHRVGQLVGFRDLGVWAIYGWCGGVGK